MQWNMFKVKEQKQRNRCEGRKSNLKEIVKGRLCIVVNFIPSYKEYIHLQI